MLLTHVFGQMAGSFILLPFPLFNNQKAAISCQALVGAGGWGDRDREGTYILVLCLGTSKNILKV